MSCMGFSGEDAMKIFSLLNMKSGFSMGLIILFGVGVWYFWYPFRLDYGDIKNEVYKNQYFKLSIPVSGWHPLDTEAMKWKAELLEKYKEPPTQLPPLPPAHTRPSVHLVNIYDKGWAEPGGFNASFFVFAEKRSLRKGIRSADEYLKTVIGDMLKEHTEGASPEPMDHVKVNGRGASRIRIEWRQAGKIFHQEYYAVVRRGYFLSFVLTWETLEERLRLDIPLGSLKFR
jgi:hypothetical protein